MAEKMLFKLVSQGRQLEYVSLDEKGSSTGEIKQISLEDFSKETQRKEVYMLLPGEQILLHEADLPKTRNLNITQVLPYCLEDELAVDIDRCLFINARPLANGLLPVAITDRQSLETILALLNESDILPKAVLSEALLLPWQENSWTLLQTGNRLCLRNKQFQGSCFDLQLFKAIAGHLLEQNQPDQVNLYGDIDDNVLSFISDRQISINEIKTGKVEILDIAKLENPVLSLDCLKQLKTALEKNAKSRLKTYAMAASLLFVSFLVQLGGQAWRYVELSQQQALLEQDIQVLFMDSFPEVKRVVDPLVQARQLLKIRESNQKNHNDDFLALLYGAGESISQDRYLKLGSIQYRQSVLNLRLLAKDISNIETFRSGLDTEDWLKAEIVSTRAVDEIIEARLRLRRM